MNIMLNSLNSIQARKVNTRTKLADYFPKEDIQDFYLRVEADLQNGKSSVEFLLGASAGRTAGKTERLLQNNDAFAPVALGLFVKKAKLVAGVESPGNDSLLASVDATIFNHAGSGNYSEAECVQAVYNSDLAMYADGKELLYKVDTQMLEAVFSGSGQLLEDAMQILTKEFVIFGGNDNKVTLDMKGAITDTIAGDPAATATEKNKAVLIFSGLIIRGGADRVNHLDASQLIAGNTLAL